MIANITVQLFPQLNSSPVPLIHQPPLAKQSSFQVRHSSSPHTPLIPIFLSLAPSSRIAVIHENAVPFSPLLSLSRDVLSDEWALPPSPLSLSLVRCYRREMNARGSLGGEVTDTYYERRRAKVLTRTHIYVYKVHTYTDESGGGKRRCPRGRGAHSHLRPSLCYTTREVSLESRCLVCIVEWWWLYWRDE